MNINTFLIIFIIKLANALPINNASIYYKLQELTQQENYKCPYTKTALLGSEPEFMRFCTDYNSAISITKFNAMTRPYVLCVLYYTNFKELCAVTKDPNVELLKSILKNVSETKVEIGDVCRNIRLGLETPSQEPISKHLNEFFNVTKNCQHFCVDDDGTILDVCVKASLMSNIKMLVKNTPKPATTQSDNIKLTENEAPILSTKNAILQKQNDAKIDTIPTSEKPRYYGAENDGMVQESDQELGFEEAAGKQTVAQKPVQVSEEIKHTEEHLNANVKVTNKAASHNERIIQQQQPAVKPKLVTQSETNTKIAKEITTVPVQETPNTHVEAPKLEPMPPQKNKEDEQLAPPKNKDDRDDINMNQAELDEENEDDEEFDDAEPEKVDNKVVEKSKPLELNEENSFSASYPNQTMTEDDSYFFSYFMVVCIVFILGYVGYHNKQKILALVLEGRKGRRTQRRRPNSANYHKLDCNLEEAVTSSCNKNTTNVIY